MARKRVQLFKEIETYDLVPYPTEYESVMRGDAYWHPSAIKIIDYKNKFIQLGTMRVYDLNHPRCYFCGKFVPKGDVWKGKYLTGPCSDCYEDTRFY